MIVYLSLLVALAGLVIHFAAGNAKTQALGMPTYAIGLLAFLLQTAPRVIDVIGR